MFELRSAGAATKAENPTRCEWVRRILDGIVRTKAPAERVKREENLSPPLTMQTVRLLRSQYALTDDYELTLFAALALAVAALTRPNALTGTTRYPERGIRAEHLTFFSSHGTRMPRPPTSQEASTPCPDYCEVWIPVDKNDQEQRGQWRIVSAPTAVSAAWSLWLRRPQGHLFLQRSGSPLSAQTVIEQAKKRMPDIGVDPSVIDRFTAKAGRRGGASTLAAAGASDEQIAAAGGWATDTFKRYVAPAQQRAQALAASRLMEQQ